MRWRTTNPMVFIMDFIVVDILSVGQLNCQIRIRVIYCVSSEFTLLRYWVVDFIDAEGEGYSGLRFVFYIFISFYSLISRFKQVNAAEAMIHGKLGFE